MKPMKAAAVSLNPAAGQPLENAEVMCRYLDRAAADGCQLVVFPEAALTGYGVENAASLAIHRTDPAIFRLCRHALKRRLICAFGFIEKDDAGRLYLSCAMVDGTEAVIYRKCHLGFRERTVFTPGSTIPVFRGQGAVLGASICMEAHIPELHTVLRKQGAEIVLMPYASGMSGDVCRRHWMRILPARASDNGVFVIACNLVRPSRQKAVSAMNSLPGSHAGGTPSLVGGGIMILDPKGEIMAEEYRPGESYLTASLPGILPRDLPDGDMHAISYFDRRRPDLY